MCQFKHEHDAAHPGSDSGGVPPILLRLLGFEKRVSSLGFDYHWNEKPRFAMKSQKLRRACRENTDH